MTIEEAIREFEKQLHSAVVVLDSGFGTHPGESDRVYRRQKAMAEVALAALRAQQEAEQNAPLTLGELRGMDGDKIYIQFIGILRGFYDDEYAPYYGQHEQYVQKYNGMLRACDLPLKYYGESWQAYRRKPEEGK